MKHDESLSGIVRTIAVAALFLVTSHFSAQATKPNIVFILTDNLGYGELGVYGGGILRGAPTPRIDKLATKVPVGWKHDSMFVIPNVLMHYLLRSRVTLKALLVADPIDEKRIEAQRVY